MNVKEQSVPGFKLEEESHAVGEEENNTVVMHCVGGRERLLGNLKSMSSRQRLIVVNFGNTVTPGRNNLEEEGLFGSQFPSIQSLVDKKGGHTMVTAKKKEKIGDHITSKETLTHTLFSFLHLDLMAPSFHNLFTQHHQLPRGPVEENLGRDGKVPGT